MSDVRTHIDNNGRVLIPAQIRKKYNLHTGDVFVVRVVDGEIRMLSLNKAVADAQALIRQYIPKGVSLVDEIIKLRREEYIKEDGEK